MLARMFVRSAADAGINYAASRSKPESEMTPEEREQAKKARELTQRARDVSKVTRRLWR